MLLAFVLCWIQISLISSSGCFTCPYDYQHCNSNIDACIRNCSYITTYSETCDYTCQNNCEFCAADLNTCLVCQMELYGDMCENMCTTTCRNRRCARQSGYCEINDKDTYYDWNYQYSEHRYYETDVVTRSFQWIVAGITIVTTLGFFAACILYKVWNLREVARVRFSHQRFEEEGIQFCNRDRGATGTNVMKL